VLRWLTNFAWPAQRSLPYRVIWWATWAYLLLAVVSAVCLWGLGDRWWLATVLLFGPRWVLLLPVALLIPALLLFDRHLLPLSLIAGLVVLFPVMGFQLGLGAPTPEDPALDIRVLTFNVGGGERLATNPVNLLREWNADVVALQECGRALSRALRNVPGWNVDTSNNLCLATRFEIEEVLEMDREALEFAGGSGLVVTYLLDPGNGPFFLTSLYLDSPREGLGLIAVGRLWEGIPKIREKSLLRSIELGRARRWVDQFQGPHVVVGDFNTPPESRSYREFWSGWQNAFSEAGRGLGGTRLVGWIRPRIDHVVADQNWMIVDAWVEPDAGSDHLPSAAILRLRK
jgi:endonuclease/exonuclease/phosphatase (EEP) superfamily protein YafD